MASRSATGWRLSAFLGTLALLSSATTFAQAPPITIENRTSSSGGGEGATVVTAPAGSGITLVFRIGNPATVARTVGTQLSLPAGWQALFVSGRLDLPALASAIETVTVAAPRNATAGDYPIRYEARLTPSDPPATATVTVRIAERRHVTLSWLSAPTYLPSVESGRFELLVTNAGNLTETVTLDVRSSLGASVQTSWVQGALSAGEIRRVRVIRPSGRVPQGARETLTAIATVAGMTTAIKANLGFDVVAEGRSPNPPGNRLPTALALRTGTDREFGFGSFTGGGVLGGSRSTLVNFGFVSRDRSHPLMFERDRNFLNITAPGWTLALGDQNWSLSYLTEGGHYGLGAGGRIERRHWSAGAFAETGRYDVREGSQAGGFLGLSTGRVASVSAQYLARFAGDLQSERVADIGSVRLILKPLESVTGDFEAGVGQTAAGRASAMAVRISFNSQRLSLYGRRVRKDDTYPLRDRTGLIDGAGLTLRPFGRFRLEGTLDSTAQLDDPTLPIDAPTRRRTTRARAAWGSLVNLTAGRTEWTSPGRDWTAAWRRESATVEMHIPLRALWLAPGYEQGTEATPLYPEIPYSVGWLHAGVRMGQRNSVDVRFEIGRGADGDADRTVRRISFGAALQPIDATRLTVRMNSGARDVLWLRGTQWITASLDQRLPWRHHVVVNYQRRSGGSAFVLEDEAYRLDYVIPIGIPLKTPGDTGRITVRLRDATNGQAQARVLVQINGQSRLTDRNGVVSFTGLKPGDYHVSVAADSLGTGRTLVPAMPLRVSVKAGGHVEVNAAIVGTGRVTGALQVFQSPTGGAPPAGQTPVFTSAAGIANALIELVVNEEHRTAVTDTLGRFSFDDVPPGMWRLRVVRADIPAFYRLEDAQVTAAVASGQTRHIVLRVIPKSQITLLK